MKFAKVMFSQVSVCLRGSLGLCPGRSLSRGVPLQGEGVSLRGISVSVQRLSVLGGLCPVQRGVSLQGVSVGGGGLCPGGSLFGGRGSLSRGVSVQGDLPTVTSGRYASYWNAFLFHKNIFTGQYVWDRCERVFCVRRDRSRMSEWSDLCQLTRNIPVSLVTLKGSVYTER